MVGPKIREAVPTDPRFWSLTPYYFIAMPFVMADPGVNPELAEPITVEGRTLDQVYATFDPGTGDAPDDPRLHAPNTVEIRMVGDRIIMNGFPVLGAATRVERAEGTDDHG